MTVSLVVAASSNNVIGRDGGLPWHLPDDLRQFKRLTTGKPVIMGRRTFESIGKPLPDRRNIVMTRDPDFAADGCEIVSSAGDAIDLVEDVDEVMIIGGGMVYHDFMPLADRIYLTRVQGEVEGDTRFPELDMDEWDVVAVEEYPAVGDREFAFDIETLDRRRQ